MMKLIQWVKRVSQNAQARTPAAKAAAKAELAAFTAPKP